jgi:hypothetical protein
MPLRGGRRGSAGLGGGLHLLARGIEEADDLRREPARVEPQVPIEGGRFFESGPRYELLVELEIRDAQVEIRCRELLVAARLERQAARGLVELQDGRLEVSLLDQRDPLGEIRVPDLDSRGRRRRPGEHGGGKRRDERSQHVYEARLAPATR